MIVVSNGGRDKGYIQAGFCNDNQKENAKCKIQDVIIAK